MKLSRTTHQNYHFIHRGNRLVFPRVSRILDAVYGPMQGDPEHLKLLASFGNDVHAGMAGRRVRNEGALPYVRHGVEWLASEGLRTKASEFPVWCISPGSMFAGRVDRWAVRPGENILVDWKTGAFSPRHEVQTNFYDFGASMTFGVKFSLLIVVQLTEMGAKPHVVRKDWSRVIWTLREFEKIGGEK